MIIKSQNTNKICVQFDESDFLSRGALFEEFGVKNTRKKKNHETKKSGEKFVILL